MSLHALHHCTFGILYRIQKKHQSISTFSVILSKPSDFLFFFYPQSDTVG